MQKGFSRVLIIVIVAAVIAGGVLAFWQLRKEGAKLLPGGEEQEPEEQGLIDITADWETYQNEKYGFEIKYPPWLKIEEFSPEEIAFSDKEPDGLMPNTFIAIKVHLEEFASFDEYFSEVNEIYEEELGKGKAEISKQEATIGDEKGYMVKITELGEKDLSTVLVLFKEEVLYEVGIIFPSASSLLTFNKMLATLRFID